MLSLPSPSLSQDSLILPQANSSSRPNRILFTRESNEDELSESFIGTFVKSKVEPRRSITTTNEHQLLGRNQYPVYRPLNGSMVAINGGSTEAPIRHQMPLRVQQSIPITRDSSTLQKGLVSVLKDGIFSRWKDRFLVLTSDYLHFFNRKSVSKYSEMGAYQFKINLADVSKIGFDQVRGHQVIKIETRSNKYYIRASSNGCPLDVWIHAISGQLKDCWTKKAARKQFSHPLWNLQSQSVSSTNNFNSVFLDDRNSTNSSLGYGSGTSSESRNDFSFQDREMSMKRDLNTNSYREPVVECRHYSARCVSMLS